MTTPYGSWASPVSVEMLTADTVGLSAPSVDGTDVYWLESRASEGGRTSLWQRSGSGAEIELTPAPFNVRSRVNEYGGGEYAAADQIAVFSDVRDGRLYRVGPATAPEPITPAPARPSDLRYGDLRIHPAAGLVLAVREDHRGDGEAITTVVALDLDTENPDGGRVLCQGADFYASPELGSNDQLAWVEWDHPDMPWDATRLVVGRLVDGAVTGATVLAGAGEPESVLHPRWDPSGELIFCSDRSDWWNLYAVRPASPGEPHALSPREAEFCLPPWQLGARPYALLDEHRLLATVVSEGSSSLVVLDRRSGEFARLSDDSDVLAGLAYGDGLAACVLRSTHGSARLAVHDLRADLARTGEWTVLRRARRTELDPASVSVARAVSWDSELGPVHGWFYPPTSATSQAPADTRPPLIVQSHGGPTAMAGNAFDLGFQFWTTRGVAVLDVNYGGSTGYGRPYRNRLRDAWGVVDVADCVAGAIAMGEQGLADPKRLVIAGGSAGGYTTLQALVSSDAFAAGISSYGIGDLEALARETHKFESRYLDRLVGPYPEDAATYRERSPLHHVDRLSSPILLLQGSEDAVVPPDQAESMAAAVRAKGLPVALIIFDGEGHGFRRSETIQAAQRAELSFLGRVLGFEPADALPELEIDNLPPGSVRERA